ncbi:sulfatase family protein [Aureibaculum conchae]|uniref:sulfatase family protein n=1 Tax=Aureibaculum sp. 2308TA14-22 TaxID=3108392 RepID=UPI003392F7DB
MPYIKKIVLPICILALIYAYNKKPKTKETQPPNIIVLFPDDMGYGDVSGNGHPTIKTPNIDRIANNGIKLTNFYSGSPACTASRYSLLTGKYPIKSGFDWVLYPKSKRGIHPKEFTLAEGLKSVGYKTAMFGKWHLGSTKLEYLPLQNGFDEYIGLPYSNDMIPPKWPAIPLFHNNDTLELNPDQTKLTKLYTNKAIDFIEKNKENKFFVYLPYAMPHVPLYPGKDFQNKSERGEYGDVIEEIDWSVGKIIQTLEKLKIDKNTVVFFASDNGPWIIKGLKGGSSGLFRDGKGSTWEGGMRVPGIIYWPSKAKPALNSTTSTVRDIYATTLSLAGVTMPPNSNNDGNDLSQLLNNSNTKLNDDKPFFFYGLKNEIFAVRKGAWKLHVKTHSQTGKDYFEGKLPLLFNVNIDPSENHDISDKYPEIVKELQNSISKQKETVTKKSNYFDGE